MPDHRDSRPSVERRFHWPTAFAMLRLAGGLLPRLWPQMQTLYTTTGVQIKSPSPRLSAHRMGRGRNLQTLLSSCIEEPGPSHGWIRKGSSSCGDVSSRHLKEA